MFFNLPSIIGEITLILNLTTEYFELYTTGRKFTTLYDCKTATTRAGVCGRGVLLKARYSTQIYSVEYTDIVFTMG